MTDWTSGYVADLDYVHGFYAEQMPAHLDLACLMQGVYPPRTAGEPFTYCELGCGLGETALVLAACHSEAEVYAFDFNPGHIAYAQGAARAAGLGNVHFAERSFTDLAAMPEGALPQFDYVTAHGIWSWIAREHQLEVVEILSRFVRPGGVVAVTYNAQPSWSRHMPLQRLLFDYAATQKGRSDERIDAALHFAETIRQAGSLYIDDEFLKVLFGRRERSLAYLAHEYLNAAWQPVYHADIAADMARAKLVYVGSATLLENLASIYLSEEQLQILADAPASLREALKDHFNPRIFRRDLFVRGLRSLAPLVRNRMLESRQLIPGTSKPVTQPKLTLPQGEIELKSPFFAFLTNSLQDGGATLSEIKARPGAPEAPDSGEVLAVGLDSATALSVERIPTDAERERIRRVNLALVRGAIEDARSMTTLAAITVGGGLQLSLLLMLAYEALATGTPEEPTALAERCRELLSARGEHLRREGTVLDTPEATMDALSKAARVVLDEMLPLWRRLGVF